MKRRPKQPAVKGLNRAVAVGERVFIRRPAAGDRAEFIAVYQANRRFLQRWWPRQPDGRPEAGPAVCDRLLRQNRSSRHRKYLICLKSTGQIIGSVSLNGLSPHPFLSTTMGYWISKDFARRGLTTEAVNLVVEHAFRSLKLHRVEANIMPNNTASLALIRKCGFRFEGLAKRYLQIDGKWRDHEHWGMTIEDWRARA